MAVVVIVVSAAGPVVVVVTGASLVAVVAGVVAVAAVTVPVTVVVVVSVVAAAVPVTVVVVVFDAVVAVALLAVVVVVILAAIVVEPVSRAFDVAAGVSWWETARWRICSDRLHKLQASKVLFMTVGDWLVQSFPTNLLRTKASASLFHYPRLRGVKVFFINYNCQTRSQKYVICFIRRFN